ncbi:F-box/LRR-repeat protein 16-like [Daktulosphaira vitifoliae]|uniref:F-box/LRR-repeat protein 16-like n=1 Tax=Daktulosphaira vitifoliae TaxID=58002 RepID=UPI0021AA615E|nr:F-box/LRR-repeat protein 16-like [Daktulosphaira vitifoliae]
MPRYSRRWQKFGSVLTERLAQALRVPSTMSSQGVVERASAELSKRINGLTLRAANKPSSAAATAAATCSPSRTARTGTSVMERVTNVLCGTSASVQYPRFRGRTPVRNRAAAYRIKRPVTWSELMRDEQFLNGFFLYFSASERIPLTRVCSRWRDVLYRSPKFWYNVRPVIRCKQLRAYNYADKAAIFKSFAAREITAVTIYGAQDQDTVEFVNTYPFPSKNILSLCLQSSSVTDRGLESFLDHLQGVWQLELIGCNEITEAGLWACLTPRIVSLTLSDCINVADDAVGAVAQMLPALNEFTLQAYHVTDAALGFFSSRQSNSLSALRLQSCWELTNHGIVNIGTRDSTLQSNHYPKHFNTVKQSACNEICHINTQNT